MTARGIYLAVLVALPLFGCPHQEPPRHAILITIDTLRADRLGAYGHAAARTPNLDSLAAGSIRFERAYAPSSMTMPSIASLFTGRLPGAHGVYWNGYALPEHLPTLATSLQDAGFATAAFLGSYALRPSRGLSRGFESFTKDFSESEKVRKHPENLAGPLTDAAIDWLSSRGEDERIFLWIHYQEPHGPYTPPHFAASGKRLDSVELPRSRGHSGRGAIPRYQWLGHGHLPEYLARYDGEIEEFDTHLGRLLESLDALDILNDSVVVLTSDHGEAFGEDEIYCAHGEGLGDVLLRVPLLVYGTGAVPGARHDRVRLIDVAPTLMSILGIRPSGLDGTSLLDDVGDRVVVAQVRGLSKRRFRLVKDGGWELRQEEDLPATLQRSDGAPGAEDAEIRARLHAILERDAPWPDFLQPAELSAGERAAMRALGYIDAP